MKTSKIKEPKIFYINKKLTIRQAIKILTPKEIDKILTCGQTKIDLVNALKWSYSQIEGKPKAIGNLEADRMRVIIKHNLNKNKIQ